MVGRRPSAGRTLRFLGLSNGLGPFFFFSSWAEAVKHITKASDTRSKRMDELYTMEGPRQCRFSQKFWDAAARALRACGWSDGRVRFNPATTLYAQSPPQVASIELQLRDATCVQFSVR